MANLKHEEQLHKIFANINEWLKFAEAKNFGLLSLNAAIVFGFTQTNFSGDSIISKAGFYVFSFFALFSFLTTLFSLIPIVSKIEKSSGAKRWVDKICNWLDKERKFENIYFYGYLRGVNETEFEAKFLEKIGSTDAFSKLETDLSTQILYNSRITWLKYQLFKIGAFIFLSGIVAFIISLPIFQLVKYFS